MSAIETVRDRRNVAGWTRWRTNSLRAAAIWTVMVAWVATGSQADAQTVVGNFVPANPYVVYSPIVGGGAVGGTIVSGQPVGTTIVYSPLVGGANIPGNAVVGSPIMASPVVTSYAAPTVTTYSPVVAPAATYAPSTIGHPVVIGATPAVTTYRPALPTTAYQPYTNYAPAAAPLVTAYSPAITGTAVAPVAAVPYGYQVGPAVPVLFGPKVFVPGQPIRNFLRAITP